MSWTNRHRGGAATSLALEEDLEEVAEERAEDVFDDAKELAAEYDVEITTAVQLGHPARAIDSVAVLLKQLRRASEQLSPDTHRCSVEGLAQCGWAGELAAL